MTRRCLNCGHAAPDGASCPRCFEETALAGRFPPPEPGRGWIKNFVLGFDYFITGFKFISQHPKLFNYIIIPLLISLVIFAGMVYGGFKLLEPLGDFMDQEWYSWLEWLRQSLAFLLNILLFLLSLFVSFFLTLFLSSIINSPFYDFLSERVEELYLGRKFEERFSLEWLRRSIVIPVVESTKMACFQGLVFLGLFLVSLISGGLGTVLFALVGPYFGALAIFDFVMARKSYTLAEKRGYMRSNLAFSMGFGTPIYFLPFLAPFAVIGATLGFLASRYK